GEKTAAEEIFRYIAEIGIEYFSNMHLKELPYYQAYAWKHLGEELKAQQTVTTYRRLWSQIENQKDNGFFSTTPFFISFTDDPAVLREAQHCYLNALIADCMGKDETARELLKRSLSLNTENLAALDFLNHGFLQ
ncbi:MAG TPA: hypothetical protein DCE08_06060, partial [Ruminococcaceae bacterium]|nr:hypothetical protein [Oscillospiraceae bacterium]